MRALILLIITDCYNIEGKSIIFWVNVAFARLIISRGILFAFLFCK